MTVRAGRSKWDHASHHQTESRQGRVRTIPQKICDQRCRSRRYCFVVEMHRGADGSRPRSYLQYIFVWRRGSGGAGPRNGFVRKIMHAGAVGVLDLCLGRLLASPELKRTSYSGGEPGWDQPQLARTLMFVSIERADLAVRYVNGDWSEIGRSFNSSTASCAPADGQLRSWDYSSHSANGRKPRIPRTRSPIRFWRPLMIRLEN